MADEDDEKAKEMAVRRQKETARNYIRAGDDLFVNGKLTEAWEQYVNAQEVLRKMEAKLPSDLRFKKAMLAESERRVFSVQELLPKEQKKDPMAAMRERRAKEAASASEGTQEDPEVLIAKARRALRETCDRIKRQVATAIDSRNEEPTSPGGNNNDDEDAYSTESARALPVVEKAPLIVENEEPTDTGAIYAGKIEALSESLESDLKARKPVIKLPRFVYDGIRGIQQVGEDDFNSRSGSPTATPPSTTADTPLNGRVSNTDNFATEIVVGGEHRWGSGGDDGMESAGVTQEGCVGGGGGGEMAATQGAGSGGAAERLRDLVGAEFVPQKEVGGGGGNGENEEEIKSLERVILQELEEARKGQAAAKAKAHPPRSTTAPYTVSQLGDLRAVEAVAEAGPYAMAVRPVVGRGLRGALGLNPDSAFSDRQRKKEDSNAVTKSSDSRGQGDSSLGGGGGGSVGTVGMESGPEADTTPAMHHPQRQQHQHQQAQTVPSAKVVSELREAKSVAVVLEYQCVKRTQGVSFLRPEAAALMHAERATVLGTPSGLGPSPPSESDVDAVLRLPPVANNNNARAQQRARKHRSKYEPSSPPLIAPTPPASVNSPDDLSATTPSSVMSPPWSCFANSNIDNNMYSSAMPPSGHRHEQQHSGASSLTKTKEQPTTAISAVERMRRLTSALNNSGSNNHGCGESSGNGQQSQLLAHSTGRFSKSFSVEPTNQPLLMSHGQASTLAVNHEMHPTIAAARAAAEARMGKKEKKEKAARETAQRTQREDSAEEVTGGGWLSDQDTQGTMT